MFCFPKQPAPDPSRASADRSTRWAAVRGALRKHAYAYIGGAAALIWLLFRSGTRPTRLTYPCQRAALGMTAGVFGGGVVTAILSRQAWLAARLQGTVGRAVVLIAVGAGGTMLAFASWQPERTVIMMTPPADYTPHIFRVINARGPAPGRFGGVDDLTTLMGTGGLKWHRSQTVTPTSGPEGMIRADSVVLIKINAQWPQRGGTNTDVLRGVIRQIVEHPDGFVGEVVVADNGQGSGGLDRAEHNAEDHSQSTVDVVNDFVMEGWSVSAQLWDGFRAVSTVEYIDGNMSNGYIVNPIPDPQTAIRVSYPKFQTGAGTYISYKYGIWSPDTGSYDSDRLVVINIPVFKTHVIYGITGSVKNHMGVVTRDQGTDSHLAIGRGGLGSFLAEVRMPDLTILDCIWILARPGVGPWASYDVATRRDLLLASTDAVALDAWAAKHVMIPQIIENGYTLAQYYSTQDPDNPDSVFRQYLDLTMNEMLLAGISTTNDYTAVELHTFGEAPIPTLSEWGLIILALSLMTAGTIALRPQSDRRAALP